MSQSLCVPSYAKLNLVLRVLGKRDDGFHELESLFERIDLHDDLSFFAAPDGQTVIACDHPAVPTDERNLVHKAATLLRERYRVTRGVKIVIVKRIPVAAGLAGGSSNAAAALQGLNVFWGLKLSRRKLLELAKILGSDVAFFLHDADFGLGTGRGEKIRPVKVGRKFWHVLVTPKTPLLTRDVYAAWAGALTKPVSAVTMLVSSLRKNNVSAARRQLFNDLEGAILRLRPSLLKLQRRMIKAADDGVCFSGSGPSIFALMDSRQAAERVAAEFRRSYAQVFVVATY